jgi:hypothetical protein
MALGITMTQKVLIMPRFLMSIYVGIIPPLKSIVKTKTSIIALPAAKSLRESGYAANMVITTLMAVPTNV